MFCARAYRTISRLPPTDYGTWLRGQDLHLRRHAPNRAAEAIALTRVSDQLVRSPAQAPRIHTRELGGVVLREQTVPAPPIPKQTRGSRVTALHADLCALVAANSPEAC